MTDQVAKLNKKGVMATFLGSAQKADVMGQVAAGDFHMVYTTPESFFNKASKKPREAFQTMAEGGNSHL